MKREVWVEYIGTNIAGNIYLCRFIFNNRELGHWPVVEAELLNTVVGWARDGKRPM